MQTESNPHNTQNSGKIVGSICVYRNFVTMPEKYIYTHRNTQ